MEIRIAASELYTLGRKKWTFKDTWKEKAAKCFAFSYCFKFFFALFIAFGGCFTIAHSENVLASLLRVKMKCTAASVCPIPTTDMYHSSYRIPEHVRFWEEANATILAAHGACVSLIRCWWRPPPCLHSIGKSGPERIFAPMHTLLAFWPATYYVAKMF